MKISIFIFLSIFFISCFSSKQTVKNYTYDDFKLLSNNITKEILKDISGNVVVLPLYTKETGKQRISKLGKIISEEIQYNVAQKKDIKVMERVDLDKLINEYELLTSSGFTNDEQDKKMGWEGANFIILGTIEEIMGNYDVRIKIIDKKTGTVKPSPLFTLKKDKEGNFEKIFTEPANYTTYTEQLVDKSDVKEKDNSLKSEELKEEDSQKTFDKNKSNAKTELNNAMNEYDGKERVIDSKTDKEIKSNTETIIEKKEIPKFECTLYNCNPNLEKFEELPKITEKYFSGTYIIKPLYAIYTFKDDGESGVGDLFVNIKVGDANFSTKNNFKQDINEVEFDGEYFEVDINKDNLISLSLWDADAFDDDVLVSKEGLIPMDLDENGIITLKNERGTVSFLVIKKPYFEGEYKIYNKEISNKESSFSETCFASIDYLLLFHKNKTIEKNFYNEIDKLYNFSGLFTDSLSPITTSLYFNKNNIISLTIDYVSYNCMRYNGKATFTFNILNGEKITIEKLLVKNALNSNSISTKISALFKKENKNSKSDTMKGLFKNEGESEIDNILTCEDKTNINFNEFILTDNKIIFIQPDISGGTMNFVYPSFSFEELEGILDFDNDILKKTSK